MAYKSSPRGTRPVSLLAIHTAEGARTARALAAYFWRDDIAASSHDAVDAHETIHMVPYERAAWTLRSGNPISDNLELCGFARWTRGQWLSTGVVDGVGNPRAMLDRTAAWIRARARARGIPMHKLSVTELGQGLWGVIAHADWTEAKSDGTHWDPGPGVPWDYVMDKATETNDDEEDDVKPRVCRWQGSGMVWAVTPGGHWHLPNEQALKDFAGKWGIPVDAEGMPKVEVVNRTDWFGPNLTELTEKLDRVLTRMNEEDPA